MGLQDNDIWVRGSDSVGTLSPYIMLTPMESEEPCPAWHSLWKCWEFPSYCSELNSIWCLGQYIEAQGPEEGQSVGSSSEGSRFLTHALSWTAKNYTSGSNPAGMVVTQGQM